MLRLLIPSDHRGPPHSGHIFWHGWRGIRTASRAAIGSGGPAAAKSGTRLPKPYEERALLVRSVIGLKPETEDALREELKRIEGQIECADTEKTNIEQDLHDQLRHALRILREQVDFVLPNPQVGVDLPTLLVTDFFTSMKDEVDQTEKNRQSARQARLANTLSVKKYLDSLKENILIHKKESTTARERLSTSASSELKELLAVMEENPMCPANKLISECDHVQALRKTYEQQEALKHGKVLSFSSDV